MFRRINFVLLLTVLAPALGAWPGAISSGASGSRAGANHALDPGPQKKAKTSRRRRHRAEKLFVAGQRALAKGDSRLAERDFELAGLLDEGNPRYSQSDEIARQSILARLVERAQNDWSEGRMEDALATLEEALGFDPASQLVAEAINRLAAHPFVPPPARKEHLAEPVRLAPRSGLHSFHLRADKRSLILKVLAEFGIRAEIDSSVDGQILRFDADELDFEQAQELLTLATATFVAPLDAEDVLVLADTKDNRNKFERQALRTFYFPGLDAKEIADMGNIARNVFGLERSTIEPAKNTLSVRAPEPELEALNETYAELLGGRSVVQLEVRLYEIDKTRATNVGMVLPGSATLFNVPSEINSILENNSSLVDELLAADPSLAGNYEAILAALIASGALSGTVFNSPFAVFGGGLTETGLDLAGVNVNLLLNSSDARSFDQQKLRVADQEEATIRSGEKYPILTSNYSSLASSSSKGSIPQFQYQDLGLTLKVRPHVESNDEVSLSLDMKLSSLTGASLDNLPILANRQFTSVVSLHLGDSAILVSDLSKQESREVTGIPGLSDLPGFSATTNRQDLKDIMELAIVITPYLVRLGHEETEGPLLILRPR